MGYVFSVENLLTKEVKQIHGDRVQFFSSLVILLMLQKRY